MLFPSRIAFIADVGGKIAAEICLRDIAGAMWRVSNNGFYLRCSSHSTDSSNDYLRASHIYFFTHKGVRCAVLIR
jgi:hypothetical protein